MSKKKALPPTTGKRQYDSVLSLNFSDILEITEELGDGFPKQTESLVLSGKLISKSTVVSEDPKDSTEIGIGELVSRFLGKFQIFSREFKKNDASLSYIFKPSEVEFRKINKHDKRLILGIYYLINSIYDKIISGSSKEILIPANTDLAMLVFDPSSGKMSLELISYEDLLRKYFQGSRVLTEVQLNLAGDFLKILNSMVMDSIW